MSEERDEQAQSPNESTEPSTAGASGSAEGAGGSGDAQAGGPEASPGSGGAQGPRKLYRSSSDRVIAGVCGGLGEYFHVDPLLFRLGFAVATLIGGVGLIAYVAAWIFLPEEPGHERAAAPAPSHDSERSRRVGVAIGVALIFVGLGLLFDQMGFRYRGPLRIDFYDYDYEVLVALVIVGFGLWLLLSKPHRRSSTEAGGATTSAGGAAAGARAHRKRLTRSRTDRKIAGVCGGLAAYFNIDSSLVRIGVVVITIFTHFLAAILYVIMALVVPEEDDLPPPA